MQPNNCDLGCRWILLHQGRFILIPLRALCHRDGPPRAACACLAAHIPRNTPRTTVRVLMHRLPRCTTFSHTPGLGFPPAVSQPSCSTPQAPENCTENPDCHAPGAVSPVLWVWQTTLHGCSDQNGQPLCRMDRKLRFVGGKKNQFSV